MVKNVDNCRIICHGEEDRDVCLEGCSNLHFNRLLKLACFMPSWDKIQIHIQVLNKMYQLKGCLYRLHTFDRQMDSGKPILKRYDR